MVLGIMRLFYHNHISMVIMRTAAPSTLAPVRSLLPGSAHAQMLQTQTEVLLPNVAAL